MNSAFRSAIRLLPALLASACVFASLPMAGCARGQGPGASLERSRVVLTPAGEVPVTASAAVAE